MNDIPDAEHLIQIFAFYHPPLFGITKLPVITYEKFFQNNRIPLSLEVNKLITVLAIN